MKIVNKAHLFKIIFFHSCAFFLMISLLLGLTVLSHDKHELLAVIVNPGIFDKDIYQVSIILSLVCFSLTTVSLCLSVVRVLSHNYILLYENFVEGPTENGERIVLSKNQLNYIGLDLLGQFSLQSNEGSIILPGKADLKIARDIKRKVNQYFSKKSASV